MVLVSFQEALGGVLFIDEAYALVQGASATSALLKECPGFNIFERIAILLMAEILHQLRLVVFPIMYRVSAPSQVVSRISAINSINQFLGTWRIIPGIVSG